MAHNWGFVAQGDSTELPGLLKEAGAAHLEEFSQSVRRMRRLFVESSVNPAHPDDVKLREAQDAHICSLEATVPVITDQITTAIAGAVAVVKAGHINPALVSVTGGANAEHAPTGPEGVAATITVSVTRV